jgi:hypothetical protein
MTIGAFGVCKVYRSNINPCIPFSIQIEEINNGGERGVFDIPAPWPTGEDAMGSFGYR